MSDSSHNTLFFARSMRRSPITHYLAYLALISASVALLLLFSILNSPSGTNPNRKPQISGLADSTNATNTTNTTNTTSATNTTNTTSSTNTTNTTSATNTTNNTNVKETIKCTSSSSPFYASFPDLAEGGYVLPRTAVPEQFLNFHLSAENFSKVDAAVFRYGGTVVEHFFNLPVTHPCVGPCTISEGCNWNISLSLRVPRTWESGAYFLEYTGAHGKHQVYFMVACRADDVDENTLLIPYNFLTGGLLYNLYGGKSFYSYLQKDDDGRTWQRRHGPWDVAEKFERLGSTLSLRRPVLQTYSVYIESSEITFHSNPFQGGGWFDSLNFHKLEISRPQCAAFIEDLDEQYLAKFKLMLIQGKHEYVTFETMSILRKWLDGGGRAVFAGVELAWATFETLPGDKVFIGTFPTSGPPVRAYHTADLVAASKLAKSTPVTPLPPDWLGLRNYFRPSSETRFDIHLQRQAGSFPASIPNNYSHQSTFILASKVYQRQSDGKYCINASLIDCDNLQIMLMSDPLPSPEGGWVSFYSQAGMDDIQLRSIVASIRFENGGEALITPSAYSIEQWQVDYL